MIRLGILTGLKRERAILKRHLTRDIPTVQIEVSGARADQARAGVAALIEGGATHLVSFGYAGGLDPALSPGRLLLPERIVLPDGGLSATDTRWAAGLRAALGASGGAVAGRDQAIATPRDKAVLRGQCDALGVDMESHILAVAAGKAGLPFIVIRAISDGADTAIPAVALDAVRADGGIAIAGLAVYVALRPWRWAQFTKLAAATQTANASLGRAARALGSIAVD